MKRVLIRARVVLVGVVAMLLVASTPLAWADSAPSLSLYETSVGNVFVDGQQIQVGLNTSAPSVSWTVADVNGTTVNSSSQAAASTLQIPAVPHGWYRLVVTAAQGTAVSTATTTFAFLSPRPAASSAGLSSTSLGDFENTAEGWTFYPGSEFPGATGSFALDSTTAQTGSESGKLSGDFSGGGAYVSVRRPLPGVNATNMRFWVQAPSLAWVTIRLTDSTGQVHQQRLPLSGSTGWQPLAVTRFDGGDQYTHFGGANDGIWHGPAEGVEFVLDSPAIAGGASTATMNIDGITADAPAAQPNAVLGDYESAAEGWSFYPGSEYPGATGTFTLDTSTAQSGAASGLLSGDFTGGGAYVATQRNLDSLDLSALTLWVRTSQLSHVVLRLTDATGQVHQQRLALSGSTNWQPLTVTRFDGGDQYTHFGGANDGIWHGPAQAMSIILDRGQIIGGGLTASMNIDAVTATLPSPLVGASTHFGISDSTDQIPLIAQAGAGGARDEAFWANVETTPGTYTFPANVTSYLQAWQANQLDPLMIADYGNPNYDGGNAPYDDAGRAAFANYADALAGHYPQIHNLAVWNEWDVNATGPANETPDNYLALLIATYTKVKADHPNLTVVGGGDVDVNQLAWFETFCSLGGLRYLDVVSIHPYNFLNAPEGLGAKIDQVRALIRKYNGGIDKPIWITEDGWPTGTNSVSVDEPTQAEYLVRAQQVALAHGVQRFYVYDFMNGGTDPTNIEDNFGLVHNSADPLGAYTPKPSYVAYATAARQLGAATFLGQENPGNSLNDQLFARSDGSALRVIWAASGANTTVTVTSSGPVQVTSLYGLPSTFTPDANGHVTVPVGVWPTYVSGSGITTVTAP